MPISDYTFVAELQITWNKKDGCFVNYRQYAQLQW